MTKRPWRHLAGALLFAGLLAAVSVVGLMEMASDSPILVTVVLGMFMLSVLLVYGIELEHIRYGDLELQFSTSDRDRPADADREDRK